MRDRRKTPVDQHVRDRLVSEFDRNFLVEAGAGSGKMYSLAARMAAGVAAGIYTVDHMAVVTFTRKAAAELRGRFQLALEERLRREPSEIERQRLETALEGMERLAAGTIHAFCARLLRERPVDARIAPGFEELSDIENLRRQRQAWRDFVALARGSGLPSMLDLFEAGLKPSDLYDAFVTVCEHEDVEFDRGAGTAPDPKPVWKEIDAFWKALSALKPPEFHPGTTCPIQKRYEEYEGRLRLARRERIASLAAFVAAWGNPEVRQKFWGKEVGRDAATGKHVAELVRAFRADVVEPFLTTWRAYIHHLAMDVLQEARTFYAEERRRQNVVNYVDLLRVTSRMLRDGPAVRRALQQKYRYLLIDEFQDTDPIQAEIFLMLAAREGPDTAADTGEVPVPRGAIDPFAVPLRPGALFVVGDPKQSIFRFRRADIDIYNRVAQRIRSCGGEVLTLTANFRSLPGVCAVANTVFPPLFARQLAPYSPPFAALDPVREESEAPPGPRVATLSVPDGGRETKHADEEAARIAAYIRAEVAGGRRTWGDFLVLTRQRPRLKVFVAAFDALEIPVDVAGAGLFCGSPEVGALAGLLGALADPLDPIALVGVLRGPLFGHSDPELFRFHQAGGRFELSMPLPDVAEDEDGAASDAAFGPVLASMRRLRAMWRDTRRLPLAAAVERMLEQTGWLALAATMPGGAAAGHLLQAIDRVREIVEDGGGLAAAADALNEEETSNEAEALPLEPGRRNVVRLMNLHKAKGLEANVVFLADATNGRQFPVRVRVVRDEGRARGFLNVVRKGDGKPGSWKADITLGQPADWRTHEEEEQKYLDAERLRLLYVAGTRARDLLVVCRSEKAAKNRAWDVFNGYVTGVPELEVHDAQEIGVSPLASTGEASVSPGTLAAVVERQRQRCDEVARPSWAVEAVTRMAAHGASAERALQAAEPMAAGAVAEATDAPIHRVDAGVAWGALVHGLLEHAMRKESDAGAAAGDAITRVDLERLARWLTVETPELRPSIPDAIALVEGVMKEPFWKAARASAEAHVEVPFARLREGRPAGHETGVPAVLHGVIDLVYRAADGWHIVDYKTDRAGDDATLQMRHAPQLAQYGLAWEQATGQPVVDARVVSVRRGPV